jgi:branched-chain amino acid transport system permease protein
MTEISERMGVSSQAQDVRYAIAAERVAFVIMVTFLIVAPAFFYPVFVMNALCFALFACAFNILSGYAGLLSFGHAMFFGWAAYIAAYAMKNWNFTPELAILVSSAGAAVLGLISGFIAIRRQGLYFAMITLGLAQMMYFLAVQAPMTGGEDGIQGVNRGYLFGIFDLSGNTAMYIFVLAVFLLCFLLIHRVINSPFGEVLKAVRDNEARATSLGYKIDQYKLAAFVISATLAGTAGALKALVFRLATLTDVHWGMSGEVVLMTVLGGVGTVFGPVVGAFAITSMEHYLSGFGQWYTVIQGLMFIGCVLVFRSGVVGQIMSIFKIRL